MRTTETQFSASMRPSLFCAFPVLLFFLFFYLGGCGSAEFSGNAPGPAPTHEPAISVDQALPRIDHADAVAVESPGIQPDPTPTPEATSIPDPEPTPDPGTGGPIFLTKLCIAATAVSISDGESCPANFAAIIAGNGNSANFVCCELPSSDILTGARTTRRNRCNASEAIVGVVSSDRNGGDYTCQGINTTKYKLATIKKSCVWDLGSGSGGQGGATDCSKLPDIPYRSVGSDGCMGTPFGALFVDRLSKNCGDQHSAELQFLDGRTVPIFANK